MSQRTAIWMLKLVPNKRFGRWICAALILVVGFGAFFLTAALGEGGLTTARRFGSLPVAAFFISAVAYIVPIFHFITTRAEQAIDVLKPFAPGVDGEALKTQLRTKTRLWTIRTTLISIAFWLLQSRLLAGSWGAMWDVLISSPPMGRLMAVAPLFVWLTMTAAMSALFSNAMLLRRLSRDLDVQILEPGSYMPIGTMAVTSTLVVVGALGLLCIMWLGGPVSWWTTIPALMLFSPLLVALLLIPVLPLHQRLTQQRNEAVASAQLALREARSMNASESVSAQAAALTMRREFARLPTWPFDVPAITRFISYAIIVPLTWAGAALIEMVVDAWVS